MQRKLTEGNITKSILYFSLPILIGNGMQKVYTLVDTIMVGQLLGTAQLAAVGSASVIANLFIDLCNSFTSGFAIVIAHYYGANDEARMKKSLGTTYFLSAALVTVLSICGLLLINPLLVLTKTPAEIMGYANQYLTILISGLFCSITYNLHANVLRSIGDSTIPLFFLIFSVTLNIILDYTLIKYAGLGVTGAAAATVISQGFSALCCIVFCSFKRKILQVKAKYLKADKEIYKKVTSQGLATALMFSIVTLSTLILQTGINSLGTSMIAGYLAGRKYLELIMMPGAALAMTAANFVSQNYGAGFYSRIKKGISKMIQISFIWAVISFVIIYLFGRPIITSVTGKDADPEIINCGILYLRIGVVFFFFLFILVIERSALQGMNHKKTPVFSSCIELLIKKLAVVLFVPKLGFLGICITEPLIWCINGIWLFPIYKYREKQLLAKEKLN